MLDITTIYILFLKYVNFLTKEERKREKLAFRKEKNEQRTEPVRIFEGSN